MTSRNDAVPLAKVARKPALSRLRLSRDGLSTFVFVLPMLGIFGLFSWFPILRAIVMSVQETNLVGTPSWVGLDNFARVIADPAVRARRSGTRSGSRSWP